MIAYWRSSKLSINSLAQVPQQAKSLAWYRPRSAWLKGYSESKGVKTGCCQPIAFLIALSLKGRSELHISMTDPLLNWVSLNSNYSHTTDFG